MEIKTSTKKSTYYQMEHGLRLKRDVPRDHVPDLSLDSRQGIAIPFEYADKLSLCYVIMPV